MQGGEAYQQTSTSSVPASQSLTCAAAGSAAAGRGAAPLGAAIDEVILGLGGRLPAAAAARRAALLLLLLLLLLGGCRCGRSRHLGAPGGGGAGGERVEKELDGAGVACRAGEGLARSRARLCEPSAGHEAEPHRLKKQEGRYRNSPPFVHPSQPGATRASLGAARLPSPASHRHSWPAPPRRYIYLLPPLPAAPRPCQLPSPYRGASARCRKRCTGCRPGSCLATSGGCLLCRSARTSQPPPGPAKEKYIGKQLGDKRRGLVRW